MNALTDNELTEINGGMPMDPPQLPPLGDGPINWVERWYWQLTH